MWTVQGRGGGDEDGVNKERGLGVRVTASYGVRVDWGVV